MVKLRSANRDKSIIGCFHRVPKSPYDSASTLTVAKTIISGEANQSNSLPIQENCSAPTPTTSKVSPITSTLVLNTGVSRCSPGSALRCSPVGTAAARPARCRYLAGIWFIDVAGKGASRFCRVFRFMHSLVWASRGLALALKHGSLSRGGFRLGCTRLFLARQCADLSRFAFLRARSALTSAVIAALRSFDASFQI